MPPQARQGMPSQARQGMPPGMQRVMQPGMPAPARSGGATGNERLTAMTGAVLLVLLLVEGFTLLRLGQLLTVHFFVGMLLLGPVALKAGSTMYRFFRYYSGHPEYKRKGPPALLLRLLGPCIVLLTAGVFGSGIMLGIEGPSGRGQWLFIHKASFILWFAATAIHVLWYAPRLPRLLSREARGLGDPDDGYSPAGRHARRAAAALGGRGTRVTLLAGSLLAGLVIAMLTVHLAGTWEAPLGFIRK
jgi:hypothetical protein